LALALGALTLLLVLAKLILGIMSGTSTHLESPASRRQREARRQADKRDSLLAFVGLLLCAVGAAALLRPIVVTVEGGTKLQPPSAATLRVQTFDLTAFVSGRDCTLRFPIEREAVSEQKSKEEEWRLFEARWRDAVVRTAQGIDRLAEQGPVVALLVTAGHDIVPLEADERAVYGSNETLAHVRASCVVSALRDQSVYLRQNQQLPVISVPVGAQTVPELAPAPNTPILYKESATDRVPHVYVWSLAAKDEV
jgi:hypothetical protein